MADTLSDVREVRRLIFRGASFPQILAETGLPRGLAAEIWWACKRFRFDYEALDAVQKVRHWQSGNVPLVNGRAMDRHGR